LSLSQQRGGYGLFLRVSLSLTWLICLYLGNNGYNICQSDWSRTPKLDFATNRSVADYYGADCSWWRITNTDSIKKYLATHESMTVGLDYYAATGVCRSIVPGDLLRQYFVSLMSGNVHYFKVRKSKGGLMWEILE